MYFLNFEVYLRYKQRKKQPLYVYKLKDIYEHVLFAQFPTLSPKMDRFLENVRT